MEITSPDSSHAQAKQKIGAKLRKKKTQKLRVLFFLYCNQERKHFSNRKLTWLFPYSPLENKAVKQAFV